MKLDSSRVRCSLQSQRKFSHRFPQSVSLSPLPVTAFKRPAYGTRLAQTFSKLATAHCARWLVECSPSGEMCLGQHEDREWWLGHLFQQHRDAQSRLSQTTVINEWTKWTNEDYCIFMFCVAADLFGASYTIQLSILCLSVWHLKNAQIKSFV
jgi:hypothetical protein